MGNAGSNARERHKSGDMHAPSSPGKDGGQAFTFDKKPNSKLVYLSSTEEEEQPYYTKSNTNSSSLVCVYWLFSWEYKHHCVVLIFI